jgi:hypothetical protein
MRKNHLLLLFFQLLFISAIAQENTNDTVVVSNTHSIHKDKRVDVFGKKMAEYNESLALKIQLVNGYRLMLLNTTDRDLAMKVRTTLFQQFPEHKVYMTFQSPYIKLKIGNIVDKNEAEKLKKQITDLNIVTGNIYLLNEKVEQKPVDKNAVPAEEQ